jgi:hypothetical protein
MLRVGKAGKAEGRQNSKVYKELTR